MLYSAYMRTITDILRGLLLVWCMVISSFGVVHNAEHGFHEHSHYGHECPIYDFCEHQNLGDGLTPIPLVFLPPMLFTPVVEQILSLIVTEPVASALARAPPVLS